MSDKKRYHIHVNSQGVYSVMRRVDKDCDDFDSAGPMEEYYDNVCLCANPFIAINVQRAMEEMFPDGSIT